MKDANSKASENEIQDSAAQIDHSEEAVPSIRPDSASDVPQQMTDEDEEMIIPIARKSRRISNKHDQSLPYQDLRKSETPNLQHSTKLPAIQGSTPNLLRGVQSQAIGTQSDYFSILLHAQQETLVTQSLPSDLKDNVEHPDATSPRLPNVNSHTQYFGSNMTPVILKASQQPSPESWSEQKEPMGPVSNGILASLSPETRSSNINAPKTISKQLIASSRLQLQSDLFATPQLSDGEKSASVQANQRIMWSGAIDGRQIADDRQTDSKTEFIDLTAVSDMREANQESLALAEARRSSLTADTQLPRALDLPTKAQVLSFHQGLQNGSHVQQTDADLKIVEDSGTMEENLQMEGPVEGIIACQYQGSGEAWPALSTPMTQGLIGNPSRLSVLNVNNEVGVPTQGACKADNGSHALDDEFQEIIPDSDEDWSFLWRKSVLM